MRRAPEASVEDGDLVAAARQGRADAYEALYVRHRDRVARTAFLLVGDTELAKDVAQEAFLVGWRDLHRLRDPALFRAWVTGIAVHLSRRRRGGVRILPGPETVRTSPGDRSVSDASETTDVRVAVVGALRRLPRSLREAVVLRYYGSLNETEMAEALAVPPGTVKSRLARARRRLAEDLRHLVEES
jgi:RNA polymerase sigma-70 factor (ECF subfamily)